MDRPDAPRDDRSREEEPLEDIPLEAARPRPGAGASPGDPDASGSGGTDAAVPGAGETEDRCPRCGAVRRGGVPGRRWCLRCDGPPGWDEPRIPPPPEPPAEADDGPEAASVATPAEPGPAAEGGTATGRHGGAFDSDRTAARPLVGAGRGEPWASGACLAGSGGLLLVAVLTGARGLFASRFGLEPADAAAGPGFAGRLEALAQLPLRIALWTMVGTGVLAAIAWFERRPLVRPDRGGDLARRVAAVMTVAHLPLLLGVPVPVLGFVVESLLQAGLAIATGAWLLRRPLDLAARWIGLTVLAMATLLLASHGMAWMLGPIG